MVLPAYWLQGALKGGEISTLKGVPQAQEVLNSEAQGGPGTDQMHMSHPHQEYISSKGCLETYLYLVSCLRDSQTS